MTTALRTIPTIDRAINANRRALLARHSVPDQLSAADWQAAWDACPDLHAKDQALWMERGNAQVVRDNTIVVRFTSRRARERVIGRSRGPGIEALWSWSKPAKGGYYRVPATYAAHVKATPGATVARDPGDLCRCWG